MTKRTLQNIAKTLCWPCILGVGLALPTSVLAQDAQSPETMKPVVITGSMLPTVDVANSVAPVLVLDAKAIEKSGAATVTEVLLKIPQNNAGSFNDGFLSGNSFSKGSSSVSLRGMGPNATLVLLNSRRLASYGFAQNITDTFVDLNSIPLAAVDRIEVLKDGASALYGSDAIAGVINVILKREFSGAEFATRLGNTGNKDALEQTYQGTWGVMTDKGSAMIIADYYSRNGLFLRDRRYSKSADQRPNGGVDARSSAGNPGSILLLNDYTAGEGDGEVTYQPNWYKVPTNPAIPNNPTALEILSTTGLNRYDFNPWISAIGETKRYGAFSTITYNLTEKLEAFIEGSFRHVTYRVDAAPTPVFGDLDGYTMSAGNPYNPFGQDISFRYRLTEAGPRINTGDTDVSRLLPGLRLKLGEDWTIESALLWSESRTMEMGFNYISGSALQAALDSTDPATALNIFGAGEGVNSQDLINSLKVRTSRYGVSSLLSPDLKITGALPIDWGAGKVGLAVGGEYRQEKISDVADTFSEQNLIVSSGGTSGAGSREAYAAYGELRIPVIGKDIGFTGVKQFDIQVAGRFEDYSDFGNTFKPKVGARWRVVDEVVFRGAYSEGFRAPSLVELFQGQSVSYQNLEDPARGDTELQYKVIAGGNPDLDAEEAKSWTAGMELQPIKNLTLALDWFNIKQDGKISSLDTQDILDNEALFPGAVVRNPPTASDIANGIPGSIVQINSGYMNLSTREVEGLDFGVRYVIPTDSWRVFSTGRRGLALQVRRATEAG